MSDRGPFSPTVVGFLVAGVVAIFALSVVLMAHQTGEEGGFRATRSSPSAIGHVAFYTLLRRLDFPAGYSKSDVAKQAGSGLVIVQEPNTELNSKAHQLDLDAGADVLVVLPKYWAERDRSHSGWIAQAGLLDLPRVQKILSILDRSAVVSRRPQPFVASSTVMGAMPTLGKSVQTIAGRNLTPLIGTRDRMLLAEVATPQDQHLYVLADPDALENHGIVEPGNAAFAIGLIGRLWNGEGSIIFDETVQAGTRETRSPLQLLFQFPYDIVLVQVLAAVALLMATTMGRFGGAEEAPAPFKLGKIQLIDNIAGLMDRAGHQAVVLRRYIAMQLHDTGRALHAPSGLDEAALAAWLDRIGTSRSATLRSGTILERSRSEAGSRSRLLARLLDDARDMHEWRKEVLNESGRDPQRR